eukprot:g8745.t1
MDNDQLNDGAGEESWGGDLLDFPARPCADATDASEGSDFSPAQLAMIERRISVHASPLPEGVKDIDWQAPQATGLQHSSPIFETERDKRGTIRISSGGITPNNCHFRSWQEDNGVAAAFASDTVEKEVDGRKMTVAIGRNRLAPASKRPSSENNDAARASTAMSKPGSAYEPDIEHLRSLRRCSSSESRCENPEPHESGVAGPPLTPTDEPNPTGTSPTPRRPVDGVASSHARQPRPGRWLSSTKGAVDDAGTSILSQPGEGAEVMRQLSPGNVAGGACEEAVVGTKAGVERRSSEIEQASKAGVRGDVGDRDRQQRHQAGDAGGKQDRSLKPSGSNPGPKVEEKARKRWWGRSRSLPSPQPTRLNSLPAVPPAPRSEESPVKARRSADWPRDNPLKRWI